MSFALSFPRPDYIARRDRAGLVAARSQTSSSGLAATSPRLSGPTDYPVGWLTDPERVAAGIGKPDVKKSGTHRSAQRPESAPTEYPSTWLSASERRHTWKEGSK